MKVNEVRISNVKGKITEDKEINLDGLACIEFVDNLGNKYQIRMQKDGPLEVSTTSGFLIVLPRAANAIQLEIGEI